MRSRLHGWRALGCVLSLMVLTAWHGVQAAAVDAAAARTFAANWLTAAGDPLNNGLSEKTLGEGVTPIASDEGVTLAYAINLQPAGFVVIAADDRLSPLVMFSDRGAFSLDKRNPALAFLKADLTARFAVLAQNAAETRGAADDVTATIQSNQDYWRRFTSAQTRAGTQNVVAETWVDALIKSKWNQGDGIYNYHTPTIYDSSYSFDNPGSTDNIVCGCVATMTAQLMRYFQWPQKPIGKVTGSCNIVYRNQNIDPKNLEIEGKYFRGITLTDYYLRGGDGRGGAYRWDLMPLSPTGSEPNEALSQIGALCFDAGLSVNMTYNSKNSGESGAKANADTMMSTFQYAGVSGGANLDTARASLDARRPCAFSMSSATAGGGHAVVLDGYGRIDGRWYYHLNMGWGGNADGWYNFEETWMGGTGKYWNTGVNVDYQNIYRQPLQKNELATTAGRIISGRITDANGKPVAGVKVAIRKAGETDIHQTMLAWYDPIDPVATPIYRDWDQAGNNDGKWDDDELPGADKFRNTTDANGIWAIDKVAAGSYEIVLEKDGLQFQGVKAVTVGSANQWGLNFVATPEEELALENWWTENNVVYLEFNRAVGRVLADVSKLKIGSVALSESSSVRINPASNLIAIILDGTVPSGELAMDEDFLVIDVDGDSASDQEGVNDAAVIKVAPQVPGKSAGSASATSSVTAITRDGNAFDTVGPELTFKVEGTLDAIAITDFHIARDVAYHGPEGTWSEKLAVTPPTATISSWDAATGILTVNVGTGDAFVRVDYLPATGRPFLTGKTYHVDNLAPAIVKAEIDPSNQFVDIEWNEPVGNAKYQALTANDLDLRLHTNNGTITKALVYKVTNTDGTELTGPAAAIRAYIKYTPDLAVDVTFDPANPSDMANAGQDTLKALKVPAGVETIEILPYAGQVTDKNGNDVPDTTTTGELALSDTKPPCLTSAILGYDNYALLLTFNERIFANSHGILNFQNRADIKASAFTVVANAKDGTKTKISGLYRVPMEGENDHRLGTNAIYLMFTNTAERKWLDPNGYADSDAKRPVSVTLTINANSLYNQRGIGNNKISVTIPLHQNYNLGYARGDDHRAAMLPPAMFSNFGRGDNDTNVYTQIIAKEKLYVKYPDDKGFGAIQLNNVIDDTANDEQGAAEGEALEYYGVWYRDLDGDGRVDAVDLNFKNPYRLNPSTGNVADLKIGSQALAGFNVWVQANDPNDYQNEEEYLYLPKDELYWAAYFPFGTNPKNTKWGKDKYAYFADNWDTSKSFYKFSSNWVKAMVKSAKTIPNSNLGYRFTTLRLELDQTHIPPRTHGDRYVMVTYTAPKYYAQKSGNQDQESGSYDGRIIGAKSLEAKRDKAPSNPENVNTIWGNSDEEAGLYWVYSRTHKYKYDDGTCNAYFMVDSFGPVFAWDGAAPAPVTATAWRASSYLRNGESDASAYDYLDIRFSEPIAYAADKALGAQFGYNDTSDDALFKPEGVLHGVWGAEVLEDGYTVRYKANGNAFTSRQFNFFGALYGLNGGFNETFAHSRYTESPPTLYCDHRAFSGTAIGVQPVPAQYRVLSQDATVPMLRVIDGDASITTNRSSRGNSVGCGDYSVTMTMKASSVLLKTIAQGGAFTTKTATWYRDATRLGDATAQFSDSERSRGTTEYGLRANSLSEANRPGSAVYGAIGNITATNVTHQAYNQGKQNLSASGLTYAPDPVEWGYGYSSFSTPIRAMMSGPVYNMVKVSPITAPSRTTRIQANQAISVLGIDIAGSSSYKLTKIVVRAIDMSQGQFDPAIDFRPLADGAASGVLLLNAAGQVVDISNDGLEWSEWRTNAAGQMYREVTMRLLAPDALPTAGGAAQSFDYTLKVVTSENFNLGDSFIIEIPDDGISIGNFASADEHAATWGTPNGTKGFPFTDHRFRDNNKDGAWSYGDAIASSEDASYIYPLYDGGRPYENMQSVPFLSKPGVNVRNLYYAKKSGATNPEISPSHGVANFSSYYENLISLLSAKGIDFLGTEIDLDYNVDYVPGDDVWYDIGGEPGVYDEGIDIPLFGNANAFPLPWQISEAGAQSPHLRAAAPATAGSALASATIAAPSGQPVAVVGVDMQDAGAGFGPRYVLNGSILIETISKNAVYGNSVVTFSSAEQTLAWNGGAAVAVPAKVGERAILVGADGAFMVVRRLEDTLPTADTTVDMVISSNDDRDIQQPTAITGVRILGVGRGNEPGAYVLSRSGNSLSWNGGPAVDVSAGGHFILNPASTDYLKIQVSQVGGAASETLAVYQSEGRTIMPFLHISGLEIMAVSDMIRQGFYTFSYDGAGALSWGTGSPVKVNALKQGDLAIVYGDGQSTDYPHNYIVVRRGAGPLPAEAVSDSLFVNQTQLLKVDVTLTNVKGVTPTHFSPMSNDETSGISLWWDANADGKFNLGDMFVPLLEAPVLVGGGNSYTCTLRPDPSWLTAWLSSPQNTATRGHNFFVCVRTTVDMSYGDQFSVAAKFYEPTEPDYENGGVCFATGNSGTISCTSITNTVFTKRTHAGQSIDAGQHVNLVAIDHFLGADLGNSVYITSVKVNIHGVDNFDPEKVFTPMDAANPGERGIVLKTATGKVVPCHIVITADPANKLWTYELLPEASAGDSSVPADADGGQADHLIAINLSDELPFGVSFYASMGDTAVSYNTGAGSAAGVRTDNLTSTINSSYADLLGSSMVSTTTGLLVNRIGAGVASAYHNITIGYDPITNTYTLSWNGNSVTIDMTEPGTYTLGSGDNAITVTFDPAAFLKEDTIVNGRPPKTLKLGDRLLPVAGQGLRYHDANANGRYDDGEAIALADGTPIYGSDTALCAVDFSAADRISFFDENGNGAYDANEAIFHDTDGIYSLPWMDHFLDSDNYVTPGQGAASAIGANAYLVDAATVSPDAGADVAAGLYLYYLDTNPDGRGYVHGEDIIVARSAAAGAMPELTLAAADKIVLDPAYLALEDKSAYTAPAVGSALAQFDPQDYLRFRRGGNDDAAFEQGEALFLSADGKYSAPSFTWTIRVDNNRVARRYNPNAPAPFNDASSALTAIIGLDLANSGATDVLLTSLTLRFYNDRGFTQSDLRTLTKDIQSGVQLWRDMDGNGIFNPAIDQLVELSDAPAWSNDGTASLLTFSPKSGNEIISENVDGIYDFFVVIQPDVTSNSLQEYNHDKGDQFHVVVRNADVSLNKPLNTSAALTTSVITIDSCPPAIAATPAVTDSDKDGFIETITIAFNERLRPGMLDDTAIWNIVDADTNNPVIVEKATLSDDYLTVTLTLAEASLGTTSGPQRLGVAYTSDCALLDWAGNPVDFTDIVTGDSIAPVVLHHQLPVSTAAIDYDCVTPAAFFYHDRNANGQWDDGEDIWTGASTYADARQRVWNGGNAWTTPIGYVGKPLANAKFCDANDNGTFDAGEFAWLDLDDDDDCLAADVLIPTSRTEEIEVLDSDHDGIIDAIRVTFSEALKDDTMTGYLAHADAFLAPKWSLAGRSNLKAWRQGLNDTTLKDAIDNSVLYFSFDPAATPDTNLTPALSIASGETLADAAGNKLNGGAALSGLATTDQARPVLLKAVASARVSADGILAAGSTITLTFSEPLVQYLDENANLLVSDLAINGAPALTDVDIAAKDSVITLTFNAETSGWPTSGVTITVNDIADSIFGDAAGHSLLPVADLPIEGFQAADPTAFTYPTDGQFIRSDSDDLAVTVHLGDGAAATAWKLQLLNAADGSELGVAEGDNSELAADLASFSGWRLTGVYTYTLKLTLTIGDADTVTEVTFCSAADSDVLSAGEVVNDGPAADTDQVLATATELAANWGDFAAANGLPAASYYKLAFLENGADFAGPVTVIGTSAAIDGLALTLGRAYVAIVEAYSADDVLLARAYSDGATAVDALDDITAPVIVSANVSDADGNALTQTSSTTTLHVAWNALDDTAIGQFQYRVVKTADSALWSEDAGSMTAAREGFATAVANGVIQVIGGFNGTVYLGSAETYSAASRTWTAAPYALNVPRANFGFIDLGDGRLVALGGDTATGPTDSIEIFNGTAWLNAGTLPAALYGSQAVKVDDNRIWLIGGFDTDGNMSSDIVEITIADDNTALCLPLSCKLSTPRAGYQAAAQRRNGKLYVVVAGGYDDANVPSAVIDSFEVETLALTTRAFATARSDAALVEVPQDDDNSDIWFIGGLDADNQALASVERLRASGVVDTVATMTDARFGAAAIWLAHAECVLVAGGYRDFSTGLDSAEIAFAAGTAWKPASNLTTAGRYGFSLAVAGQDDNERVVAFGGLANDRYTTVTESRATIEAVTTWTTRTIDPAVASLADVFTIDGLDLTVGEAYAVQLKAADEAGNWSSTFETPAVLIDLSPIVVLTCDLLPTDGLATARSSFTFSVLGDGVSDYRWQLNDGAWSDWTPAATAIELNGLAAGAYTLRAVGRTAAGLEQAEAIATVRTWTVQEPLATIAAGLPTDSTSNTDFVVAVTGNGITHYRHRLDGAAWSADCAIDQTFALNGLTEGTHTLEVIGGADGVWQAIPTSQTWTIVARQLVITAEPAIPADRILAANALDITLADTAEPAEVTDFRFELRDAEGNLVAGGSDELPLGQTVSLNALEPGRYTFSAVGKRNGAWETSPAEMTFTVAAADFASFTPELAISTTTNYTVTVSLNGLTACEYALDGDLITLADGEDTFDIGPLTTGMHLLQLWGIDANGNRQPNAAETLVNVTSELPVGDRLTVRLDAPAATQTLADGDIDLTLVVSDLLMAAPVAADFIVTNGTVKAIAPVAGNAKEFVVTVSPTLAEDAADAAVTVQLPANTLYASATGTGNAASNVASVIVYHDALLDFTLVAKDEDGNDLPAEGINLGDVITVTLQANSAAAFNGGELKLLFNPDKFALAEELTDPATLLVAPYVFFKPGEDNPDFELLDDGAEPARVIGFRLAALADLNQPAPAAGTVSFITLKLKAIAAGIAADDDLRVVAADNAAVSLAGYGLVAADSPAIRYGNLAVAVTEPVPTIAIALDETTVTEGENATLTASIDYVASADIDIVVTGDRLLTIYAGELTASCDIVTEADSLLTGDYTIDLQVEFVSAGNIGPDSAVTLNVLDADAQNITVTASDETIREGESVTFTAALPEGVTAKTAAQLTFNLTASTLEDGCYIVDAARLTIPAGASTGSVTVTTYPDDIQDDGHELVLAIDALTVVSASAALFTKPEPITVGVANTDATPGDFSGDGKVDYTDILMFAEHYGTATTPETAQYDLNSDGVIDYKDVLILASAYDSGSTRSALYAAVRATPVIYLKLVETSGKSVFQFGDTLSFELRLSASEALKLKGGVAVVSYDSSVLDVTSELTIKAIIDEDWRDLGAGVEVQENGAIQLRGINLEGIEAEPGQEITIARFTMEAKAECAAASVTLSAPEGTSDRGNTVNGTLDAETIQAPAFTITNGDNPPAIILAFEVTSNVTRASEKVGLILATKADASADFATADGDIAATPAGPEPYRLAAKAGDIELVRDVRPLADDTTWPIAITVTEGTLTLDWSLSLSGADPDYAMPAYYNFYLDLGDGSQPIHLNAPGAATSIELPVGSYTNAAVRAVKADFCKTLTLSLNAGWNLIGLPFTPDDDSTARLAALKPSTLQDGVYSPAAVADFTAGQVLWLNLDAATELTLSGIVAAEPAQGVAVKPGWNFVTPLWGATLTRPDVTTVPIIWRWTSEGYRNCLDASVQELGRGYWLYSTIDQIIWTK